MAQLKEILKKQQDLIVQNRDKLGELDYSREQRKIDSMRILRDSLPKETFLDRIFYYVPSKNLEKEITEATEEKIRKAEKGGKLLATGIQDRRG